MSDMQEIRMALPSPGRLFTPGVTILLSLIVAGFLGFVFAPNAVFSLLALDPQRVIHGSVWQLVTYPFIDSCPWRLISTCLILLFVGSVIEREWRTASFLWLWLAVSVGTGILWVLINLITGGYAIGFGAAACSYGLIAAMGLLLRGRQFLVFFATMKAQHIAIGLIVIGILANLATPITLVWVLGALISYLYIKARWSLRKASARPILGRSGGKGQFVDID